MDNALIRVIMVGSVRLALMMALPLIGSGMIVGFSAEYYTSGKTVRELANSSNKFYISVHDVQKMQQGNLYRMGKF